MRLILFLSFSLSLSAFSQRSNYTIGITQNGIYFPINYDDSIIKLKQEPFTFNLEFNNVKGIYLNASFKNGFYSTPKDSALFEAQYIPFKCMSEDEFNVDKDIIIAEDGFCYWFYQEDKDWYRMDKTISIDKNLVKSTVTVERIFDRDAGVNLELSEIDKPIYFLFFLGKTTSDSELTKEFQRKRIIIQFD